MNFNVNTIFWTIDLPLFSHSHIFHFKNLYNCIYCASFSIKSIWKCISAKLDFVGIVLPDKITFVFVGVVRWRKSFQQERHGLRFRQILIELILFWWKFLLLIIIVTFFALLLHWQRLWVDYRWIHMLILFGVQIVFEFFAR